MGWREQRNQRKKGILQTLEWVLKNGRRLRPKMKDEASKISPIASDKHKDKTKC